MNISPEFLAQCQNIALVISCVAVLAVISFLVEPIIKKFKLPAPKISPKKEEKTAKANVITSQDIKAIAGDDVMTTQLDLARAYIEMGKKPLAKKILQHVIDNGSALQQDDAQQLMQTL